MTVVIIAAVARNGVIGRDGTLPWDLPDDLARFRELTLGHSIIMGRKTFESIGRPLPKRKNIVITRQTDRVAPPEVTIVGSLDDALAAAEGDPVFVIGGTGIFRMALPQADILELTEVHQDVEGDTYFPEVDWTAWTEVSRDDREGFSFVTYRRV